MDLYDAGVGDVIGIPAHHPAVVTVTGWANTDTPTVCIWSDMRGTLCRITWTAPGAQGTTTLSDATVITMITKAGPDDPARKQYEAELEAVLAGLLDTVEED